MVCSLSYPRRQPFLRRIITRLIGLIPSVVVAIAVGQPGIDTLLVASQVVLSIVLPFIVFPLVYLTSGARFMSVRKPRAAEARAGGAAEETAGGAAEESAEGAEGEGEGADVEAEREERVDFSNGRFMTYLGWLIWVVIVLANAYAIVTLAMGED